MANNTQNPLSAYFRAPKLYTSIPSAGQYYTPDVCEVPENGELPIFAMTAKDEMIMKNPDALLNGEAVAQVIQSCVPNVKNARKMLSSDIDVLLIAIQGATFGDDIEVSASCPECETSASGVASVSDALATMGSLEDLYSVKHGDNLEIKVRPFTYASTIKAGITNFQSTRSLQALADIPDEMERLRLFNDNFKEISALNFELIADSIHSITILSENIDVNDRNQIAEFLDNADNSVGKAIEDQIQKINESGINTQMQLECENTECSGREGDEAFKFVSKVNFDPVNFFTAS